MSFAVTKLEIPGLRLIKPERIKDSRGYFEEVYNERDFVDLGITTQFVQDNHSYSRLRGTVRGLHFQKPPFAQAKLVLVIRGSVLNVVVDIRKKSTHFGKHIESELSCENGAQLFVPAGFAHGFCTLEDNTEVLYKASALYNASVDMGIQWNDPVLKIKWPEFAGTVISERDRLLPCLNHIVTPFDNEDTPA